MIDKIIKYPRTPHLQGSRLQAGDEDLSQRPFSDIDGRHLVLEEKVDGANSAISFSPEGELRLQSRGHFLTGGYREKHYDLMKQWAAVHHDRFFKVLGTRYIMYGEWLYAKHSIYYDRLPSYFLEFDILDRETGLYLDTPSRHSLIKELPVHSVPVLAEGMFKSTEEIVSYLGDSHYISPENIANLHREAEKLGLDADAICRQTDDRPTMEGIYIKIEEDGAVVDRMKYVRNTFLQTAETATQAWLDRAIVPNGLAGTIEDMFV